MRAWVIMVLNSILDGLLAATTLSLRYTSILFVCFYPLGPKFLPRIYRSFAAYVLLALSQVFLNGRKGYKKRRNLTAVAFLGCVDGSRPVASALTALTNFLCLAASVDYVYRAHFFHPSNDISFSRMGYVDTTTARVTFRAPTASAVEMQFKLESGDAEWKAAGTVSLSSESDWVGSMLLDDLLPDTVYVYTTNASHSGTFKTAQEHPKKWTMLQTSCMNPFYPYNPLDHALRINGLEHLSQYVSNHAVDFMLFLGDFIYVDLPYPLGWTREHYTTAFRQTYASPSWTDTLKSLPWIHTYDDHEIVNDWSSQETGLYKDAIPPYWDYQGRANPPSKFGDGVSYYTFQKGDVAFFVLDTRRYRSDSSLPDGPEKTMLGASQLDHLRRWLKVEEKWKVVVSSVPFTRNWRSADENDRWAGYLWERDLVMGWMRATDGVILLSGDRHEHATTEFPPLDGEGRSIIEFSTSALNQFFEPFNRTFHQIEDTDVAIHNHYKGNSKFAAISFDTSDPNRWSTHFDLIVDGQKAWDYDWSFERNSK